MRRLVVRALAAALLLSPTLAGAEPSVRVAVLPVVVHAIGETGYLQRGIADMLATRLEQQPGVSVVRVADAAKATLDPEGARQAAKAAGASYAVFGSFTQFGDGASLDLRCVSAQGGGGDDARSIFVQAGSIGDIIPHLDDVAQRVGRYVVAPSAAAPAVAAGPGAPAPQGPAGPARQGEVDALRSRVERLESVIYGRQGTQPAPAPAARPAPPAPVVPRP